MSRRRFSKPFHNLSGDDPPFDNNIPDFGSVALYIPAIQVIGSTVLCCATVLLSGWTLPHNAVSSIRSVSLCLAVAAATVKRPARIGNARGMDSIFNTIRPAVLVYIAALVVEQLAHSCVTQGLSMAQFRMWLFQCCMVVIMAAGFVRAWYPQHENDAPFVTSILALAVAALLPPSPNDVGGPLCAASTGMQAIERISRALLFSSTYCTLAFAAHPRRSALSDVTIVSIRAAAGSIWVLGISAYFLPLVPVQTLLVLFSRIMRKDNYGYTESIHCEDTGMEVDHASQGSDVHSPLPSPRAHEFSSHLAATRQPMLKYDEDRKANSTRKLDPRHPYDHTDAYEFGLPYHGSDVNDHPAFSPCVCSPASSVSGCNSSLAVLPGTASLGAGFSFGSLDASVFHTPQSATPLLQLGAESPPIIHDRVHDTAGLRCISGGGGSDVSSVSGTSKHGSRTASAEQLKAAAEALEIV